MKKVFLLISVIIFFCSCATITGGAVTENQKRKPKPGEPSREIKIVPFVFDLLFFPFISLPIDFSTNAIYKK